MDNLYCKGNEKRLSDCRFEGWGLNDCDSIEAAGVICDTSLNSTSSTEIPPIKSKRRIKVNFRISVVIRCIIVQSSIENKFNF